MIKKDIMGLKPFSCAVLFYILMPYHLQPKTQQETHRSPPVYEPNLRKFCFQYHYPNRAHLQHGVGTPLCKWPEELNTSGNICGGRWIVEDWVESMHPDASTYAPWPAEYPRSMFDCNAMVHKTMVVICLKSVFCSHVAVPYFTFNVPDAKALT